MDCDGIEMVLIALQVELSLIEGQFPKDRMCESDDGDNFDSQDDEFSSFVTCRVSINQVNSQFFILAMIIIIGVVDMQRMLLLAGLRSTSLAVAFCILPVQFLRTHRECCGASIDVQRRPRQT